MFVWASLCVCVCVLGPQGCHCADSFCLTKGFKVFVLLFHSFRHSLCLCVCVWAAILKSMLGALRVCIVRIFLLIVARCLQFSSLCRLCAASFLSRTTCCRIQFMGGKKNREKLSSWIENPLGLWIANGFCSSPFALSNHLICQRAAENKLACRKAVVNAQLVDTL